MSEVEAFSLLTGKPVPAVFPTAQPPEAIADARAFVALTALVICDDSPHWGQEADRDKKAQARLLHLLNQHSKRDTASAKISQALESLEECRAKIARREGINPAIHRDLVARRIQIAVLSCLAPLEPEPIYSDADAIKQALQAIKTLQGSPVVKLLTEHATCYSHSTYLAAVLQHRNGEPLTEVHSEAAVRTFASNPLDHLQRFVQQLDADAKAQQEDRAAGAKRIKSENERQARFMFSRMVAAYEGGNAVILRETDDHLFALEKFTSALFNLTDKGSRLNDANWRRAAGRHT